jgi:hypothetical protein
MRVTDRTAALQALQAAKARKDTRGQHSALQEAYRATHAILANPPRKPLAARLWARIWGKA